MLKKLMMVCAAGLLALSFAACTESLGPAAGASGAFADGDVAPQREVDAYRLDAGDQVRVIVYGEEELSGEFFVDGAGMVSLPLIGEIEAGGQTLREFRRLVEEELSNGYLNSPRVSAEVLNYRPYYILGEVAESGEYPYSDGLTVMNAVATAGGFTYRANRRVVYIKRAGMNYEQRYELSASTPVQPGDTIRIGERYF